MHSRRLWFRVGGDVAIAPRFEPSAVKRTSWSWLAVALSMVLLSAALMGTASSARADASTSLMNKVEAALRRDNRLNGADCYTAAPGVVVLYGKVFDEKSRTLAEKTALKVHGVKKVINTLTTTTGTWREEENRINDTLQLNGFPGASARVIGGTVYVSGNVNSEADKQRATRVISSISKLNVINYMRVLPGSLF